MKLGEYLARSGLPQRRFARCVRRTPATVSRWVNGIQQPDLETIAVIRRLTDGAVTFDDWIEGDAAA